MFLVPDNALSYWGSKGPNPQQLSLNNQIVHTVGKNESLWTIARYFDVDSTNIAELNDLENPDLIFPGDKLTIYIQDDFSIRVVRPVNLHSMEAVAHVVYPAESKLFAPENPTAIFEIPEIVSRSRSENSKQSFVFRSFQEFISWVATEFGFSDKPTEARSQSSFDPTPTSPYLISSNLLQNPSLGGGIGLSFSGDNYLPPVPNSLSPPPKKSL